MFLLSRWPLFSNRPSIFNNVSIKLSKKTSSIVNKSDAFGVPDFHFKEDCIPEQSDVIIVGGGVIGWAVAFWLKFMAKISVTVIERDPTYKQSSSVRGMGGFRIQFSEAENIQMALFAYDFLREVESYLSTETDEPATIDFNPHGNLLLADQIGSAILKSNYQLQLALNLPTMLLNPCEVGKRWPWLNLEDISLASYGEKCEGWFNPCLLIHRLRNKAHLLGVNYVVGEVTGFAHYSSMTEMVSLDCPKRPILFVPRIKSVKVKRPDGNNHEIICNMLVNAAGPWASEVVEMALAGTDQPVIPLPVQKRLQSIFVVRPDFMSLANVPGIDAPFLIDHNGLVMQRMGLCGDFAVYMNPSRLPELQSDHNGGLYVDKSEYYGKILPFLTHRIPGMVNASLQSSWAVYNDYNPIDQSPIIGPHPYLPNLVLVNGFSGLGTQHSIAVGRAISEYILYRQYQSIDLTRFSFDRFYLNIPITERTTF